METARSLDVVFSLSGHDKGREYVILSTDGSYALVVDGKTRKLTKPKRKSLKHLCLGKTGSAEYGSQKGDSHAWFTGFAPSQNPQIVVTILVEGAGSGGDYAVPIAKRIFDAYFN